MSSTQDNLNVALSSDVSVTSDADASAPLRSPEKLKSEIDRLVWQRDDFNKTLKRLVKQSKSLDKFLAISDEITSALEALSESLFEKVLRTLERNLTTALQEVLGQPIVFKTETKFKNGSANVQFHVERDGNSEDIQRGQGGSVQNVLSVGLRIFALAELSDTDHRRFLVLDEQDCWLRPELVPHLVNIVHQSAKELDFQVIMISHHDERLFEKYADTIYRLDPTGNGLKLECVNPMAHTSDAFEHSSSDEDSETIETTDS